MNANIPAIIGAALGGWEMVLIGVSLLCFAFWIWMIVDCAIYETSAGTKVAWLLMIILGWIIGAPLYYFVRKIPRYFAAKPAR
jgi:hypothetical protein